MGETFRIENKIRPKTCASAKPDNPSVVTRHIDVGRADEKLLPKIGQAQIAFLSKRMAIRQSDHYFNTRQAAGVKLTRKKRPGMSDQRHVDLSVAQGSHLLTRRKIVKPHF